MALRSLSRQGAKYGSALIPVVQKYFGNHGYGDALLHLCYKIPAENEVPQFETDAVTSGLYLQSFQLIFGKELFIQIDLQSLYRLYRQYGKLVLNDMVDAQDLAGLQGKGPRLFIAAFTPDG